MHHSCLICQRIAAIKNGDNPSFVKELETGYVVIGDHQYYTGYTLFLCKRHVGELHELDPGFRAQFLQEMSDVAYAVYKTVQPHKLNYELLGNAYPHLHWHIFPRYNDDPHVNMPIWVVDKTIRTAPDTVPTPEQVHQLKTSLLRNLG